MIITLHHLAKFFLYAAIMSVVVVMSSTFFPFIGGKYYFFRIAIELGLVFLLLWWAFEAEPGVLGTRLRTVSRRPLFIAVSAFALMFMLAVVFADDPYGAFWSNYERGEGGFQMLHYYLFFVLLSLLLDRPRDWQTLFRVALLAAVAMIGYGLLAAALVPEFIGPYTADNAPNVFSVIFSASRFQGSLGNPAYVAPYLIFTLFYVLWQWAVEPKSRARHILYGALTAFFFVFFILSQTRGAFIGLIAGAFIFLGMFAWRNRRRRVPILAGVGVLVGALVLMNVLFAGNPALEGKFPGGRLLNTSFSANSAQTRLWTWGSAWQGFLERPVFGWGPENFSTVFDKFFDTRHFEPARATETWFDRAHSNIFDYLATTGLAGLGAYLAMFAVLFIELFQYVRNRIPVRTAAGAHPLSATQSALLAALPIAYFVQALILFDVLPIYLNLFLFLAFASFLFGTPEPEPQPLASQPS